MPEEYSMWVMPISGFIELDKLQPHQLLRASEKIVQYNESMSTVFFLSHQCVVCPRSLFCCTHGEKYLPSALSPIRALRTGEPVLATPTRRWNSCAQCSASSCA